MIVFPDPPLALAKQNTLLSIGILLSLSLPGINRSGGILKSYPPRTLDVASTEMSHHLINTFYEFVLINILFREKSQRFKLDFGRFQTSFLIKRLHQIPFKPLFPITWVFRVKLVNSGQFQLH